MTDFEKQLTEIDSQIHNLKQMEPSPTVASNLGMLQGQRMSLLKDFGEQIITDMEDKLQAKREEMHELKTKREQAKIEVAHTFNLTAQAVKNLRDTEYEIKKVHQELQDILIDANRAQGKPFTPQTPPTIHYRAIGHRDRLGALDNWYGVFSRHFLKMGLKTDDVVSISRERFFDNG